MSHRIFGIKTTGYMFKMDQTKVCARELKDGSWTFVKHDYEEIKDLDSCMAFGIMFLLQKGVTSFSTVGIKADMPIVKFITDLCERRTSKRIHMPPYAHRYIDDRLVADARKATDGEESVVVSEDEAKTIEEFLIRYNIDSASTSTTYSIDDAELRDTLFGNENEGDAT